MKPDAFMRMYWNEFWQAVQGLDNDTIVAYERAFTFYYHHSHCAGLRDDDEYLRRLCQSDKSKWQEIRDVVFDNDKFMTQDANGLWHQKRTEEEWNKAVENYATAVKRANTGAKERWKNHKINKRRSPKQIK